MHWLQEGCAMGHQRDQPSLAFRWLRSAIAAILMAYSLAFGLTVVGRVLPHLPDTIRRGDLPSALGVLLVVTMCAALFSVGASLWIRSRSWRAATAAAWERVFQLACGLAVGLMLLILTVSIVTRL
jgi:hypothetical protein